LIRPWGFLPAKGWPARGLPAPSGPGAGSTTSLGQLPIETKCPDPPDILCWVSGSDCVRVPSHLRSLRNTLSGNTLRWDKFAFVKLSHRRSQLSRPTVFVPAPPEESVPSRRPDRSPRLKRGCRGSLFSLVKKDPHHRRGSFFRSRRGSFPGKDEQTGFLSLGPRRAQTDTRWAENPLFPFSHKNSDLPRSIFWGPRRSASPKAPAGAALR
jgi:hypothetical protein